MRVHIKVGYERCRSEVGHIDPVTVVQCIKGRFNHNIHEGWTPTGEYVTWHTDDVNCSSPCPTTSERNVA